MFFAYSCGDMLPQEGESNSKNYGPYIPSKPIIYTGDINISVSSNSGVEKVDGKALFSEADVSSNYTFSLENAPTALSVNSTSGELSVNVSAVQVGGLYDDIVIKAKKIIKPKTLNGQIALANIAFRQDKFLKAEKIIKRLKSA